MGAAAIEIDNVKGLLKGELMGYGLNPEDWILEEGECDIFPRSKKSLSGILKNILVRNFSDDGLHFFGLAEFEEKEEELKARWVELSMGSLL